MISRENLNWIILAVVVVVLLILYLYWPTTEKFTGFNARAQNPGDRFGWTGFPPRTVARTAPPVVTFRPGWNTSEGVDGGRRNERE